MALVVFDLLYSFQGSTRVRLSMENVKHHIKLARHSIWSKRLRSFCRKTSHKNLSLCIQSTSLQLSLTQISSAISIGGSDYLTPAS